MTIEHDRFQCLYLFQGNIVREAKTNKSAKDVIDAEVKKLLELKSKLALAKGEDPNATPNKSKGKKAASKPTPSQPKPAETTSNENIDQALVAQLEAEVATQVLFANGFPKFRM